MDGVVKGAEGENISRETEVTNENGQDKKSASYCLPMIHGELIYHMIHIFEDGNGIPNLNYM